MGLNKSSPTQACCEYRKRNAQQADLVRCCPHIVVKHRDKHRSLTDSYKCGLHAHPEHTYRINKQKCNLILKTLCVEDRSTETNLKTEPSDRPRPPTEIDTLRQHCYSKSAVSGFCFRWGILQQTCLCSAPQTIRQPW